MWIENMTMALAAIKANKMRSFLTMLGIIIGIGSVISIVSIGDTMRGFFADLYADVGTTQAYIAIGHWVEDTRESDYFTLDELERVKEIFGDEIDYINTPNSANAEVAYGRDKMRFDFEAIDYNFQDVYSVEIMYGRYLNEGDILGRKKNVVMEHKSAKSLFGTEQAVGKTFRTTILGETGDYTVVGVYKKDMNVFQAMLLGANGGNGSAYIPYTLLTMPNDNFYYMQVYGAEGIDLNNLFDRVLTYVAKLKGRNTEDFFIYTAQQEMNTVDAVMGGLSLAVGGIAAISLVVGGIGIMNIMLVSVTERTREIGIRKSLGAKTRDIMIQFLTESAILAALGGIIGVLTGSGIVVLGGTMFGLKAIVKPSIVLLAVGFSAAVGIFFGLYPASKAARKDPIEALRYE